MRRPFRAFFLLLFATNFLSACSTALTFSLVNNTGLNIVYEHTDKKTVKLASGVTSKPLVIGGDDGLSTGATIRGDQCVYVYDGIDWIAFARHNPPSGELVRVRYEVRVSPDFSLNVYRIALLDGSPVAHLQTGGGFPAEADKTCT